MSNTTKTDGKTFGNFENIKKTMLEAKQKAEQTGQAPKEEPKPTEKDGEMAPQESFTISIAFPSEKVEKKVVNYYFSKNLIGRIKKASKAYKKKDSNFLEEVLDQVLSSLGY